MPNMDKYGTIPVIEQLRNIIEFNGLYDQEEHSIKHIENTNFIAVAAPPGGGRNHVSVRFVRHLKLFNLISN